MPSSAPFCGSGDTGSDSGSDPKKFSVPLASVAKSTQKLHVANIPPNMEESGLRYIFGQFGEISSIYLKNFNPNVSRGSTTWAFVTFDNPLAASTAMEKVNMTNTFGLYVKLAMSEQEKSVKRMTEQEKDMLIFEQQRKLEAFQKTRGIGRQEYPVDDVLGPMEGKAVLLKECAKARSQPTPASGFQHHEKNAEVSDFSPYEYQPKGDIKKQNTSISTIDESQLKPFVLNGRTLPCLAPPVPPAERTDCSYPPCKNNGQVRCARCKIWYCTQRCQINDWQHHKSNCEAPPPLEKPDGTPFRPPSQSLRLSSSSAAFCDATSRTSPQHMNATMPDISDKTAIKSTKHNTTGGITNGSSALSQTVKAKYECAKDMKVDANHQLRQTSLGTENLVQPVYKKTILDTVKVGDLIQIITNLEEPTHKAGKDVLQPTSCPAVFSATCFQDQDKDLPVLDYVLGTLQEESHLKQLKTLDELDQDELNVFGEGKVVVAFDEVENAYSRYIYLQPDLKQKKATLVNIDSPKVLQNIPFSKILPAQSDAYIHPSLGFQFTAIGKMTPNIEQRVMQMAVKESFEAKVLYTAYFDDGRLKNMTAALLTQDKKPIMTYKISPYFTSTKVAEFLKLDSATSITSSLKNVSLSVTDQVHGIWDATIKFGQWSDLLLVMRAQDINRRKELQDILQECCANAPPINACVDVDVHKLRGCLVACKFPADGQYYRAVITGSKPDKARIHFVDFGNVEVEEWKNIVELPKIAKESEKYPKFVTSIRLDNMPDSLEFGKDLKLKSKLTQLEPLFKSPLQIKNICDADGVSVNSSSNTEEVKYVLMHPNGKTIQNIIQDKLNEKNEEASKGDVQGGTIEGTFDYNKCHFAEIIFDPALKGYETVEQDIIILNAESPSQIFVCPSNQIGLAEDLLDQVRAYVAAVGDNFLGAAPVPNHLCIAKSEEDDQWYRAVCCKELGDDMYELMFVDYGNVENVTRKNIMHMADELMKTPLLANHCVLEGFEDSKKSDMYQKVFGDKLQELLPAFEETKITVLKKLPNSSTYIVRIPCVTKVINPDLLPKEPNEKDQHSNTQSSQPPTDTMSKNEEASVEKADDDSIMRDKLKNIEVSKGDKVPNKVSEDSLNKECDSEVDKILSSATKLSKILVKPGSSVVGLGFDQRSNQIYVQRLEDADEVEKVSNILKEKGTAKHLSHLPDVGQLVACKWSEDGEIYRAEVIEVVQSNKIKVHFIDYGNTECETLENITELPIEVKSIPKLAPLITLQGVASIKKEGNKVLCDLLQDVEAKLLEDIMEVKSEKDGEYLLIQSDGKSFNDLLKKELEALSKETSSEENVKVLPEKLEKEAKLSQISVKTGTSIVVLGFDQSSDKMYVQRLEDVDQLEKVSNILKDKGLSKHLSHLPDVGQLVACKWSEDGDIYRAEVKEVLEGKKIKVHFIDFGNTESENMENITELPNEVKSIPILASLITLEGVASIKKEGNKVLCDILEEVEAKLLDGALEVTSEKDGEYLLSLSDGKSFNDVLKKELESLSREVTSEENVKMLQDKLEKEAKQREDEEKRKDIEDQIKKMQEMLASMSK